MDKSLSRYYARKAWESYHKACLLPGIQVHHRDGNALNNAIDNLIACTPEEHKEFHRQLGHKIQPAFIAKADFYTSLNPEQVQIFKAKSAAGGRRGKGRPRPEGFAAESQMLRRRQLERLDSETGKIVDVFRSVSEASAALGLQRAHIRRLITKERRTWHGYEFRYKAE